jgi:hypothetical protein
MHPHSGMSPPGAQQEMDDAQLLSTLGEVSRYEVRKAVKRTVPRVPVILYSDDLRLAHSDNTASRSSYGALASTQIELQSRFARGAAVVQIC